MTASEVHTKEHRPPERCSDLLGADMQNLTLQGLGNGLEKLWK